jgi:histidinol-phosphate phosphatase family protein
MRRALFLDRDGTIIEDRGYMRDPDLVELLPGAARALQALARQGWALVVVSNQSGVGRGLISSDEMTAVHSRFLEIMRQASVGFTASYFCVHLPDEACPCRKPSVFHLKQAALEHELDLSKSWMIGDRPSDILCGRNAGCRTIWLLNPLFPVAEGLADFVARDWDEIRRILAANAESNAAISA